MRILISLTIKEPILQSTRLGRQLVNQHNLKCSSSTISQILRRTEPSSITLTSRHIRSNQLASTLAPSSRCNTRSRSTSSLPTPIRQLKHLLSISLSTSLGNMPAIHSTLTQLTSLRTSIRSNISRHSRRLHYHLPRSNSSSLPSHCSQLTL